MLSLRSWTFRLVDVVGAGIVTACALGIISLTMFDQDQVREDVIRLTQSLERARHDHRELLAALSRQRKRYSDCNSQRSQIGHLPEDVPVEAYFQHLSQLALHHGLRVVRHQPLAPRSYPGLFEKRFAYEVTGSLSDLMAFLQSIESADFWADVSYLSIERGIGGVDSGSTDKVALLTLSLFAARAQETPTAAEGT